MKLGYKSDGTPQGTSVFNLETGQEVAGLQHISVNCDYEQRPHVVSVTVKFLAYDEDGELILHHDSKHMPRKNGS